ncbi:MAG: transcription elongation factor subunit Spt4 [Candidatus Micrarchaeaceae archaeon]
MEKACKNCRLIIAQGTVCPVCGSTDLTTKWHGYMMILNAEKSELAKKFGITINGTYALSISE